MDAPFSPILRPGDAASNNDTARRDPPLDSAETPAVVPRDGDVHQSQPRAAFNEPRPIVAEPRPVVSEPRSIIAEPRPVVPDPRSSFDPRATYNEQRIAANEPRMAVQEPRPQQNQATAAIPPLEGAEEAALRDIGEDPALRTREAKPDDNAGKKERPVNKERPAGNADDRRANRKARREAKGRAVSLPATTTGRALDNEFEKPVRKREPQPKTKARRQWTIPWTAMSFLVMVLIPAGLATFYYVLLASPQYQVETQFSVRGASQSSIATLGLPMIGGGGAQSGDSYIVTSYVESLQLIRDVQQQLGIDLRQFYTRDHIDWLYRIDPAMPLEKFTAYWRDMTDVSFNATTGNTTLYIYAFSAEDSKAIADAVLKVSERLVNELSESNRQQVMQVASKQVDRSEERLRKVQGEVRKLRETEKVLSPESVGSQLNQQIVSVQSQLTSTKTRLNALLKEVDKNAPQARSMKRTIDSLEAQLAELQSQLDATSSTVIDPSKPRDPSKQNVAEVLNKFEELTVEQGFATQAYTTALAAFETAIAEAQKQERYFATFVSPTRPEIALYPLRWLDSFIAFLVLMAVWLISQFLYRSFRDHAV
ncbi:MAG: chain length determinant family protein [Rhizobium sp.]|nr:chain length determinant family protein [Rhizobium sp.]